AGFYVGDAPTAEFYGAGNVAHQNKQGWFLRDASHGLVVGNTSTGNCVGFTILNTGSPGPAADWTLRNNTSNKNDKFCPGNQKEHSPPLSGTGIGLVGATNSVVTGNTILSNVSKTTSPPLQFAGGIVLASSKALAGSVESGTPVSNNT